VNAVEILKSNEELIRQKYGVKRIGVFGSFAREEAREGSDVNVIVKFREDAENADNYIKSQEFFS
jgi:predicted nucleotidyltransferase